MFVLISRHTIKAQDKQALILTSIARRQSSIFQSMRTTQRSQNLSVTSTTDADLLSLEELLFNAEAVESPERFKEVHSKDFSLKPFIRQLVGLDTNFAKQFQRCSDSFCEDYHCLRRSPAPRPHILTAIKPSIGLVTSWSLFFRLRITVVSLESCKCRGM